MNELIADARHVAKKLAAAGLTNAPDLLRRLADALDMQRIDLEGRKKCHEEAMLALRGAQDAMLQARGLLETIHKLPEPEGFAFSAVIRCLKEWKVACGPAPFILADIDINQLEAWGKDLLKSHHDTRQALSCPPREVR
jgi:hypothetical protein